MRSAALIFVLLMTGCGSDDQTESNNNSPNTTQDAANNDSSDTGSSAADAATEPDATAGIDLGLADMGLSDMRTDSTPDLGEEVDPDVMARLIYINQQVFREDKFFARGGTAVVELVAPQELPADTRTEFFNADGERCTYESGTEWPVTLPNGGTWPVGPFLDGGDLSLAVTGAPGPVVYGHLDTYYVREAPGAVVLENITYSSFFPPEYIPHGANAQISTVGGPAVGAFEVGGLALAANYSVSAPDLELGNDVIDTNAALDFEWSPAAPGDTMAVIVKDSFSYIKCVFDDDGAATVPADAMALLNGGQFVRVTVQTWREHTHERQVTAADGKVIDVNFTSRNVQIGRFDSL